MTVTRPPDMGRVAGLEARRRRQVRTRLGTVSYGRHLPLSGRSPVADGQPLGLAVYAQLLKELCDRLGLVEVDLVADHTGGALAQIFAADTPKRLRSVTLTNCEVHDNVPPRAFRSTTLAARTRLLAVTGPRLLRNPHRARQVVFGSGYQEVRTLPLAMVAPTLVARGPGDRFFDGNWAHRLAGTISNVTDVVQIPQGRLFFPDERAEDLAGHLRRHWHHT